MIDFKVNEKGEWILDTEITGIEAVKQAIKQQLLLIRKECFYAVNQGIPINLTGEVELDEEQIDFLQNTILQAIVPVREVERINSLDLKIENKKIKVILEITVNSEVLVLEV